MRLRFLRGSSEDRATTHHGPTLRQMTAEFVIVVAGILVALGVDDWKQSREDLAIRDAHLSSIAAEVRSNIDTIERVRSKALAQKIKDLGSVLRFLGGADESVADPQELLRAFVRSAGAARPWLEDAQFRAFQNSGQLRLLHDQALAGRIADLYAASDTLYPLVARIQGSYPAVVNELIPAQLQSKISTLRGYKRTDEDAPVIPDDPDLQHAIDAIRARRGELLRLARNEAAVATAQWYALSRMDSEFNEVLAQLAPWDKEASAR